MLLLLRFPKMVEVDNARLILLYAFMQVCGVSLLAWWFLAQRFYDKAVDITGHIGGSLVVLQDSPTSALEESVQYLNRTLCSNADNYNFWRDESGLVQYGNFTCSMPCMPGVHDPSCIAANDAVMQSNADEVFLPTLRRRTSVGPNGQETVTSEFLLATDSISLGLSYFFDLPLYDVNGAQDPHTRLRGSSERDVITLLFTHDGQEVRSYGPGQPLSFSLQDLLTLAGHEEQLDTPHSAAGSNRRPGSEGESPIGRLSGLELELRVSCQGSVGLYSYGIDACHLVVRKTERGWVHRKLLNHFAASGSSGISSVDYAGIRISVRGEGLASHWDVGTLIEKLTSCIVILLLPRRLVMLLCTFMLGHLSTIYRHAIYENFSLRSAIAGMSARLLVWNTAFIDLVDQAAEDGKTGITKKRLNERLTALMKSRARELDEAEVSNLCEYSYQALLRLSNSHSRGSLKESMGEVGREIGLRTCRSMQLTGTIDSDTFSVACTDTESLNFDAVVKLFDVQRQRWFMERLFTPRSLMEDVRSVAQAMEERNCEIDGSDSDDAPTVVTPPSGRAISPLPSRGGEIPDPIDGFTLEEERELRKNMHRKVAGLLLDNARLKLAHEEVLHKVEENRRHFDTRDREHYAKVLEDYSQVLRDVEAFPKRLDKLDRAAGERHRGLEGQVAGVQQRCESFEALLASLQERLAALERLWRGRGAQDPRASSIALVGGKASFEVKVDRTVASWTSRLPLLGFTCTTSENVHCDRCFFGPSPHAFCLGESATLGGTGEAWMRLEAEPLEPCVGRGKEDSVIHQHLTPELPEHRRRAPVQLRAGDVLGCAYEELGPRSRISMHVNGDRVLQFEFDVQLPEKPLYAVVDVCYSVYQVSISNGTDSAAAGG